MGKNLSRRLRVLILWRRHHADSIGSRRRPIPLEMASTTIVNGSAITRNYVKGQTPRRCTNNHL